MIKYVATDLDGTLLKPKAQGLTPDDFDLIRMLKERNIVFIAASGRTYSNMYRMFAPAQDDISYIAENGSLCIHNHQVIARGLIGKDIVLRVAASLHEHPNWHLMVSCEDTTYTDSKCEAFLDFITNTIRYKMKYVKQIADIKDPVLKLAVCSFDGTGTDKLFPYLKEHFGDELRVVTSGNVWVDFIAPNASKGSSLVKLLEHLDIDPKDGIAFGDQYNDVEMLQAAGKSYAMAHCAEGLEKYADESAESVIETIKTYL